MLRLLIFAIVMLALSGICNGQGRTSFGATRAQDTSFTKGQLRLEAYSDADTNVLVTTPNGTVKKFPLSDIGGGVDADTLQYYEPVFGVDAFGATPYLVDSTDDDTRGIQQAINAVFGYTEVGFNTTTGTATLVRIDSPVNGIVFGNGEYDIRRRLVKFVNFVNGNDTIQRPANSQLYIPYQPFNATTQDLVSITVKGPVMASFNESAWGDAVTSKLKRGFILHSHINNDGSSYPSVLASVVGDTLSVGGSPTTLNGIAPHLQNVWIRTLHDRANGGNQLCGFDAFQTGWFTVDGCRVDGDTSGLHTVAPSYRVFGIRSQRTSTGTVGVIRNTLVTSGFKYGVIAQEHVILDNVNVFMCYYAFEQSGNARPTEFRNTLAQWNRHDLHTGDFITIANGEGNVTGVFNSERWTGAARWYSAADTGIIDSLDYLRGNLQVEIFNTTSGVVDTFFKVKGATELTQISPYRTGGYVGGFTMSRGGFRTNSGSFQTGNGSLTMLTNGYVDIRLGGVGAPGLGLPASSAGSRYLLDSRFSTMGLGLNAVGANLITWHHLGGVAANNGLVYSNDNGISVTNVDSMSGTGARYFLGATNINKAIYRMAVIDTTNRNKQGWRSPLQFFSEALVNPTASAATGINFSNDQGFMGQISYTGSTFSSGAIPGNTVLTYSHLANGKIQNIVNGASGAFEVYTAGVAAGNLRMVIAGDGDIGIGVATPAASALVDMTSTTKGFLPPRMTATQASAISSPADGLLVYVSSTDATFTSVGIWARVAGTWTKL